MSIATMMATLKLNISDFATKLDSASTKLSKFATKAQDNYGRAAVTLKSHNLGLKDTARIVQGIVISQAFYAAVGAIHSATSALWTFNKELDYARITYSALFGSVDLADDFTAALQEHAVNTIFDYQQLAAVSKKLLAYGIEYENLMYIMEGLTNLGAMSGDAAAMDRIALALGQIKTTGYLTATEMRQLANAYVPIYDIVKESFGLSGKQMESIGDLKLPAEQVINAVVEYANDKFGAVGDAAMYTITGLQNRIVDTLKVVGVEMIQPLSTAYKSFLVYVSNGLEKIREAFKADGISGVFEVLVPDESKRQLISHFLDNIKKMFYSLISVGKVAAEIFSNFAHVFMTAFNILGPVVMSVVDVLAALTNAMLENERVAKILRVAIVIVAASFIMLRVQALAALAVTALTSAITNLSKALVVLGAIISKHPIFALIAALGVTLVGVASSSDKANNALSNLFATITGAGSGGGSMSSFGESLEDSSRSAELFNDRLQGGLDTADELSDAMDGVGKSSKKASGLLSFDEVYKLPEQNTSGGGGGGSGVVGAIDNLIDKFKGLGDSLIPEIPDFSEYIDQFTDSLFGGLDAGITEKLKSIGLGSSIGTIIGGIIGGILGGKGGVKLGMGIGAFAGGFAGLMWEWLEGAMSNTGAGGVAGIIGAISKALSTAGAAGIGTVIKNAFATGGIKGVWTAIGGMLKTTGLKSILKGGAIGAAVGIVVDTLAHLLWGWLDDAIAGADEDTAKIGQTIGSIIGSIVGAFFGPAGILIGSAIGTFVGGLVGLFWDPIKEYFNPENNALSAFFVEMANDIGAWYVETWDKLSTWVVDTALGFATWATDTWNRISGWFTRTKDGLTAWWNDTFGGLADWLADTIAIFTDYDNITGTTLSTWWADTKAAFATWVSDTVNSLFGWFGDSAAGFFEWAKETFDAISNWIIDTVFKFVDWRLSVYEVLLDWVKDFGTTIANWAKGVLEDFRLWKENAVKKFEEFKNSAAAVIKGFEIAWQKQWEAIKTWFHEWWKGLKTSVVEWLDKYVWQPIADFFKLENFWNKLSGLLSKIKTKVGTWWTNLFDKDVKVSATVSGATAGHATGGIFNREHIARFAEGNKAEAVVPLENDRAMQPFVDAVSNGLVSSLAPIVAQVNANQTSSLPPLYVGTLIADDRGIKQLYDKFEVIRLQESDRRGVTLA